MRRVVPTPFPATPEVMSAADLGQAVRASRTQSGVTLQQAALSLGVSKQTLQALEAGETGVSLGLALKIAQGLGVAIFAVPPKQVQRARRQFLEPADDRA